MNGKLLYIDRKYKNKNSKDNNIVKKIITIKNNCFLFECVLMAKLNF